MEVVIHFKGIDGCLLPLFASFLSSRAYERVVELRFLKGFLYLIVCFIALNFSDWLEGSFHHACSPSRQGVEGNIYITLKLSSSERSSLFI